jgi:uncharacterized membrane protein HdeD (DUF308 family)
MMRSVHPNPDPAIGRDRVYAKWALSVVGFALLGLGVLAVASLFVGAAPSVRFIGAMMALGGLAQLLHALLVVDLWSSELAELVFNAPQSANAAAFGEACYF